VRVVLPGIDHVHLDLVPQPTLLPPSLPVYLAHERAPLLATRSTRSDLRSSSVLKAGKRQALLTVRRCRQYTFRVRHFPHPF
jgi:hypothetical protein